MQTTHLLLLGGNSVANKPWLRELAGALTPHFDTGYAHPYRHWESGEELIDLEYELAALTKIINSGKVFNAVVAKSAGVLLALQAHANKVLIPQKCVFIGTPVLWAKAKNFNLDAWLKDYSLPTLFIQQSHDPAISFSALRERLQQLNAINYQLAEQPGGDHAYRDIQSLKDSILSFMHTSPNKPAVPT